MSSRAKVPYTFINVAMTADGKIAPANRQFIPFGSKRDHELLLELRATADAVMSGAATINSFPMNLGPGGTKYRKLRVRRGLAENNLRIIVSGSGSIDPGAEIFKHQFSPIIILTTEHAPLARRKQLAALGAEVQVCGQDQIDFRQALGWLHKKWGVKRLLSEGGGELNGALFQAGLVDEIFATVCPLVFGGRNSPTLADGIGVSALSEATHLTLKGIKRVGEELYLNYLVKKVGTRVVEAAEKR